MDPVRQDDRGPAVEDIQRRLLALGHDLGPTGVDGVFMDRTVDAVREFQRSAGLEADGIVGRTTWVALVDAGFTLGDRMLYLRHPFFHGRDVADLQAALNALGFACGAPDGIFGAFCERATREFQLNSGHPADGIVGPETVRALKGLRHVWEGKDPCAPVALTVAPARRAEVLRARRVVVVPGGPIAADVAERLVNLASAAEESSLLRLGTPDERPVDASLVLRVMDRRDDHTVEGVPSVSAAGLDGDALAARLVTAVAASATSPAAVDVVLEGCPVRDERGAQRVAILLLDAVCASLA